MSGPAEDQELITQVHHVEIEHQDLMVTGQSLKADLQEQKDIDQNLKADLHTLLHQAEVVVKAVAADHQAAVKAVVVEGHHEQAEAN